LTGQKDSDRHLISLFAISLASKGKTYVELGVREGYTTEPLLEAAKLNNGHLWSVDVENSTEFKPSDNSHTFVKSCALEFLKNWPSDKKIDFIYIDDWHSYEHVKKELIESMFVWAMKQPNRKVKKMEYEVTKDIYEYWKDI
jgi:predicted O-methyltransferase YrrM